MLDTLRDDAFGVMQILVKMPSGKTITPAYKRFAIVVEQQVQMLAVGEQQQLQQQVQRGQSAAVLIRLTLGTTWSFSACVTIGHLPGSPDLHGTRGYVRWTDLGRPVAVAAAVPEQDQFQSLKPETH